MKTIGILGSGIVAKTLAKGFLQHNYTVCMGTSNPEKLREWCASLPSPPRIASMVDCASQSELIVLAVKGDASESVIASMGDAISGKTVIDTTNPIDHTRAPQNGVLPYFTSFDESLMERLQKIAPQAHLVKAFSCVGNAFMIHPDFNGQQPTMFYCGNNDSAKLETREILEAFGWDALDMGKAESARAIEPLCMLWCIPGFAQNQWNHAFAMLRK